MMPPFKDLPNSEKKPFFFVFIGRKGKVFNLSLLFADGGKPAKFQEVIF